MRKEKQWVHFQGMSVTKRIRQYGFYLDSYLPYEDSDPSVYLRTEPMAVAEVCTPTVCLWKELVDAYT